MKKKSIYKAEDFHPQVCINCGQLMKNQIDPVIGELSPYIFKCDCMPSNLMLGIL